MDKSIVPAVIGGGNHGCKDKDTMNNNINTKSEEGKSTRDQ